MSYNPSYTRTKQLSSETIGRVKGGTCENDAKQSANNTLSQLVCSLRNATRHS